MIVSKGNSFTDYLVMYLLIAVSGIVFFLLGPNGTIGAVALNFVIISYLRISNRLTITNKTFGFIGFYFLVVLLLFFAQTIEVGFIPSISFSKYFSKLLLAITALILLKDRFFSVYIQVMVVLGVIGLIIHAASFAFPPFFDFMINTVVPHVPNQPAKEVQIWHNYHIIIHDFWQHDLYRNSGAFWEPGANAGFTLLAMFFNVYVLRSKLFTKKNFLFLLVIISTLSTTGYIVLVMVVFLNPSYKKNIAIRVFSLVLIIPLAVLAFTKFDFLGSKVVDQLNSAKVGNAHDSRFASARLDYEMFVKHPLGFSSPDFRNGKKSENDYRTNGIFIFLSAMGGVSFVLYFIMVYKSMKKVMLYYNPSANATLIALYFIVIIIVMAFSENYFERPLFMAISMFSPFFVTKKYTIAIPTESASEDIMIEKA